MPALLIDKKDLPFSGTSHQFEVSRFGDFNCSFFITDAEPGTGAQLHAHPYEEIFVILEGNVRFQAGDESIEATAGQIVIVPAETPHRFTNLGPGHSRHLDLHPAGKMATSWIEE
jgi:quercetin dioxygenase-like cupin family protein